MCKIEKCLFSGSDSPSKFIMDEKIATAAKKVLVEIVRLSQKRGMKGDKGDWKEFLNSYDKKFGASLSDPSRRSNDVILAFLKTFTTEDDLQFFNKVIQCHEKRNLAAQFLSRSADNESPKQRLVRLTLEHPDYASDYSFPSYEKGWVVTKLSNRYKALRSNSMFAVDCEMVLCEDGTDALVKVCVVDQDLQVKIDEYIKPCKAVVDYRSDITGITSGLLDNVTCSLADVQKSILKLLERGTILVGHSLKNDLQALKLDHAIVIDTSFIFKFTDTANYGRPSLNNLCKSILGYEVRQKGVAHNCIDDAMAAMKLVLAKIEGKIDDAIPLIQDLADIDMAKLFLHKIPTCVPSKKLTEVVPGDFRIELKPSKKGEGKLYSAFAKFKNAEEADQAYKDLEGDEEKDSSGRPQKLVSFQIGTGETNSLYVRKMASLDKPESKKIDVQDTENAGASKKRKADQKLEEMMIYSYKCCNHLKEIETLKLELEQKQLNQCCDHLKEIERMKQVLKMKEYQIATLHNALNSFRKDKKGKKGG